MGWKGDVLHMCNNATDGLFCGERKATRFQRATNAGPCAKPERRRLSQGNTRVVGHIQVGNGHHAIHSSPPNPNDPICTRIYNKKEIEIECIISTTEIEQDTRATDLLGTHNSCFDDREAFERLMKGIRRLGT